MFDKIKGSVLENEPLSRHTTFGVGGAARYWVEPRDAAELNEILSAARKKRLRTFVMGAGSNILAGDKKHNLIIIHLGSAHFRKLRFRGHYVIAGAGLPLNTLVSLCCARGLAGLEGLAGIPGTVGGAVYMNSSFVGAVEDVLKSIKVMDLSGRIRTLRKKDIKFGYRTSGLAGHIILEAVFGLKRSKKKEILRRRKGFLKFKSRTQPLRFKSAGCVFKNPENELFKAAQLIELAGLKGKRAGGAQVSPRHANYIVNLKKAKASDIITLMNLVEKRVRRKFHVILEPEIKIL